MGTFSGPLVKAEVVRPGDAFGRGEILMGIRVTRISKAYETAEENRTTVATT